MFTMLFTGIAAAKVGLKFNFIKFLLKKSSLSTLSVFKELFDGL